MVAFKLTKLVIDSASNPAPPSLEDVTTILNKSKYGNSGAGGHPERRTRDTLVKYFTPEIAKLHNEVWSRG